MLPDVRVQSEEIECDEGKLGRQKKFNQETRVQSQSINLVSRWDSLEAIKQVPPIDNLFSGLQPTTNALSNRLRCACDTASNRLSLNTRRNCVEGKNEFNESRFQGTKKTR